MSDDACAPAARDVPLAHTALVGPFCFSFVHVSNSLISSLSVALSSSSFPEVGLSQFLPPTDVFFPPLAPRTRNTQLFWRCQIVHVGPVGSPPVLPVVPAESAFPVAPAESAFPVAPAENAFPVVPAENAFPVVPAESAFLVVPVSLPSSRPPVFTSNGSVSSFTGPLRFFRCPVSSPEGLHCPRGSFIHAPFCRFHLREKLGLDIASSTIPSAGFGLFTLSARAKGDHLVEYMGEVLSRAEVELRYPKGDVGVYCLAISSNSFIDSAGWFFCKRFSWKDQTKRAFCLQPRRLFCPPRCLSINCSGGGDFCLLWATVLEGVPLSHYVWYSRVGVGPLVPP
jgi:hypothetical protein